MVHQLEVDIGQYLDATQNPAQLVRDYFAPLSSTDSGCAYSGAKFDSFAGGGDRADVCNQFTADDLVAVTFLSVEVPAHAAIGIMETAVGSLSQLLAEIPADVDLWDADESDVDASSPANRLFAELTSLRDIGWVTANKLLARKRPRLLPVYDNVVKNALQPNRQSYWLPLRHDLQSEATRNKLDRIRADAGIDESISLLRILDIVVWMREHGAAQVDQG